MNNTAATDRLHPIVAEATRQQLDAYQRIAEGIRLAAAGAPEHAAYTFAEELTRYERLIDELTAHLEQHAS